MTKYVLDDYDGPELDYSTLGFTASPGDILDATGAPDARWSVNGDQGAAETVTRYTLGGDADYVEPTNGHVLTYSDAENAYVPVAPATFLTTGDGAAALAASMARLAAWAKEPDTIIAGTITYDSEGLVDTADVVWPDGATGVFTATTTSAFGIDAYTVTYDDGTTVLTFTQPALTRDTSGAVTILPAMTVA